MDLYIRNARNENRLHDGILYHYGVDSVVYVTFLEIYRDY